VLSCGRCSSVVISNVLFGRTNQSGAIRSVAWVLNMFLNTVDRK